LLACPDLASKRWIWEQYDHMVMADTVARPGGDAAIVRVHDTSKGLAITTDCTPRYCYAEPTEGGKQAVAESWRNLTCVGALPLAITNCLNFGNPQKPDVMGQIIGCLQGMKAACLALDYPVISGNVSLYNETTVGTQVSAVQPTPAIGGVGILKDINKRMGNAFTKEGEAILLIGETKGHLGSTLYLREVAKKEEGAPPPVDLTAERANGDFVRGLIEDGKVTACHDVSDGGLLVAIAEMCFPAKIGATITLPVVPDTLPFAVAFGEDQARYIISVKAADQDAIMDLAKDKKIPILALGTTIAKSLKVVGHMEEIVEDLYTLNQKWLPEYMAK
jgi:phosphoribosylformylglycinamidine synthase